MEPFAWLGVICLSWRGFGSVGIPLPFFLASHGHGRGFSLVVWRNWSATMVPSLRGPDFIDGVVWWVYNSKDVFDSVFKRCRVLNRTDRCAAGRDGGYEN